MRNWIQRGWEIAWRFQTIFQMHLSEWIYLYLYSSFTGICVFILFHSLHLYIYVFAYILIYLNMMYSLFLFASVSHLKWCFIFAKNHCTLLSMDVVLMRSSQTDPIIKICIGSAFARNSQQVIIWNIDGLIQSRINASWDLVVLKCFSFCNFHQ